ncbi:MAG: large subunit ribosomal protein L6 [Parcubacteria group bacterium Gr01-1014_46]|nr:MAG: large subunit ribosomal protein L6 [Parcubacteria group bacterium Gr01-1014_46]
MSRIGKKVISIPKGVEVNFTAPTFTVKGSQGTLTKIFKKDIEITVTPTEVTLVPKVSTLGSRALWGTYSSHIQNMISGVTTPFIKKLILEGIGYKSEVKANGKDSNLVLALGFSHQVNVPIPAPIKLTAEKNLITGTSADKEILGSFMAKVRSLKKPEPYKGKGMRYEGEVIKRKQGKKTA